MARQPETAPEPAETREHEQTETDAAAVAQIREISQNARTTWFGLLALLAFVGVTLMAHEDANFFARGVETQLPLVGIEVPTVAFFIGAPVLLAAVYAYLHLYLVSLWEALATAPARPGGAALIDRIYPWLLSQSAVRLRWRARTRRIEGDEGSARHTAMDKVTGAVAVFITWVLGLLALGRLWTESWALHNPWLALWTGACLLFAGWVGVRGALLAWRVLTVEAPPSDRSAHVTPAWMPLTTTLSAVIIAHLSWQSTHGGLYEFRGGQLISMPAERSPFTRPANMREARLIPRPEGWQPYDVWFETFEAAWRERNALPAESEMPVRRLRDFWGDAKTAWQRHLTNIEGPSLSRADLREADLTRAFLPAADLRGASLDGADLTEARLPGARLDPADPSNDQGDEIRSTLRGAILDRAQMQGADLSEAQMHGAYLGMAQMQGANLSNAQMQGADLRLAQMQGANLRGAEMQGANLRVAQMQGANLVAAQMQGANLREAQMQGASLFGTEMQGAGLFGTEMQGAYLLQAQMQGADLRWAQMQGASLIRAVMVGASCPAATLRGAAGRNAALLCTGLSAGALAFVTGNSGTRLPAGLAIESCLLPGPMPEDIAAARAQRPGDASITEFNRQFGRLGRESFASLVTCHRDAEDVLQQFPHTIHGTWTAQDDGSWRDTVTGDVYAEVAEHDWRLLQAHTVDWPPAREGIVVPSVPAPAADRPQ
ncbi:MAG: pentapeptide repeat-containing protein [Pseudomonadota bacterium]